MISIIDRCSFLRAISAALSPCLLASWVFMPPSTKSLAIFRRLNAEAICKAVSPFCIDTSNHNLHTFLKDITQLWVIYPFSRGAQHQLSRFSYTSVFKFAPGWMEYEGQCQFRLKGYNLQSVIQYIDGIFTFLFLSCFDFIQYEGTLFCSDTEHLALIRILAIPACPYRAAVWSGVSPY